MQMQTFFCLVLLFLGCFTAAAPGYGQVGVQVDSTVAVEGVVRTTEGLPVEHANVFLLETLEGTLTDTLGRFVIRTEQRGEVTLVVKSAGFREMRRSIRPDQRVGIRVVLEERPIELSPITVEAGRYTIEEGFDAALTPLDVVTTPGTAANIFRAIQTLPGVQGVNEGNALFVRGGDASETKVFLNEAVLLYSQQVRSPLGTFIGTVDPFLLDGIFFSSGGFGARYGNALSGIVSLHTVGVPQRSSLSVSAALGTISMAGAVELSDNSGLRLRVNAFNMGPLFALNGEPRDFEQAPVGRDVSASFIWNYQPDAELKVFAIDQKTEFALNRQTGFIEPYNLNYNSRLAVVTWHDRFGNVLPTLSLSSTVTDQFEKFPGSNLVQDQRSDQLFAEVAWSASDRFLLRVGGQLERHTESLKDLPTGLDLDTLPASFAPVIGGETNVRDGLFIEVDTRPTARTRLILGVRTDHSTLTGDRTIDPRISAAFKPLPWATLTAAWGIYHQQPAPLDLHRVLGNPDLPPMRARQAVIGAQLGDDETMARVEVYDKRYDNLVQITEFDYAVVGGGEGYSRGADVFLKGQGPWGITGRLSYSYVEAWRSYPTDDEHAPGAGELAPAGFDITHTLTAVLEREWGTDWRTAVAYRYHSGAPYTRVYDAEYHDFHHHPTEIGEPMGSRVPTWKRVDISASYLGLGRLFPSLDAVVFAQVTDVFDQGNVWTHVYSADFSKGRFVPSVFTRSLYVGASIRWMAD